MISTTATTTTTTKKKKKKKKKERSSSRLSRHNVTHLALSWLHRGEPLLETNPMPIHVRVVYWGHVLKTLHCSNRGDQHRASSLRYLVTGNLVLVCLGGYVVHRALSWLHRGEPLLETNPMPIHVRVAFWAMC
jgi:hypothetical protein